jgi:hypothetical protein
METYQQYKKYTANFVDWIQKASKKVSEDFDELISDILFQFDKVGEVFLSKEIWSELSSALKSCEMAIKFRIQTSLYFDQIVRQKNLKNKPSIIEGNRAHKAFIQTLERCYERLSSLKQVSMKYNDYSSKNSKNNKNDEKSVDVSTKNIFDNFNKFSMNDEDDDNEDVNYDVECIIKDETNDKLKPVSRPEYDNLVDDLRFELMCFVVDLEKLLWGVSEAWCNLKKEKVTLISAIVTTSAAMSYAERLSALLELKYPSLNTYEKVLFAGFQDLLPADILDSFKEATTNMYAQYEKTGIFVNTPGVGYFDMNVVSMHLNAFSSAMNNKVLKLREGYFGPSYSEDIAPMRGILIDARRFLMQELQHVYNYYIYSKEKINFMRFRTTF